MNIKDIKNDRVILSSYSFENRQLKTLQNKKYKIQKIRQNKL